METNWVLIMSVYKKLQEARVTLHKTQLNKSGKNKFAGFSYFELSDFIPQVTEIFNKVGLCGVVSFTSDTAYLTVHDTDGDGFVTFTSPLVMAENAKGQAIQSLGSTHTYFRRYLWLMCMEITENDVIDASSGAEIAKKHEAVVSRLAPNEATINVPKGSTATVTVNKPLAGGAGEFQMQITAKPDGDPTDWLELVKTSSFMLLDLASSEEDVMVIFKRNKVIFDEVKATDPEFFKGIMAKFTETTNKFKE
jgi:hypothetical protein